MLGAAPVVALSNGSFAVAAEGALVNTQVVGVTPINLTITPAAQVKNYAQYNTESYSQFLIATTALPLTARAAPSDVDHAGAFSPDGQIDGAKPWTAMPVTLQAKTDVSGLTSGTTYAFRFRPVLKAGEATWSQVVVQLIQ